ncbi:hypothetical protein ACVIGB_000138 [Bradyrhizobium sp. USDA 4341]
MTEESKTIESAPSPRSLETPGTERSQARKQAQVTKYRQILQKATATSPFRNSGSRKGRHYR